MSERNALLAGLARRWRPRLTPGVRLVQHREIDTGINPSLELLTPQCGFTIMIVGRWLVCYYGDVGLRYELADPECVPQLEAELTKCMLIWPRRWWLPRWLRWMSGAFYWIICISVGGPGHRQRTGSGGAR